MHYRSWLTLLFTVFVSVNCLQAQIFNRSGSDDKDKDQKKEKLKVYQETRGYIIGYERGRTDMLRLGYHANWKKIRLKKPTIHAVEGFASVAPFTGILGLEGAYWQRQGRFKWTYGGRFGYFTNFDEGTVSVGPAIGFRLLGLHAQGGFNLLSNPDVEANRLYLSLSFLIGSHTRVHSKKGDKEKDIIKW
jgi:hypothetical protein